MTLELALTLLGLGKKAIELVGTLEDLSREVTPEQLAAVVKRMDAADAAFEDAMNAGDQDTGPDTAGDTAGEPAPE